MLHALKRGKTSLISVDDYQKHDALGFAELVRNRQYSPPGCPAAPAAPGGVRTILAKPIASCFW